VISSYAVLPIVADGRTRGHEGPDALETFAHRAHLRRGDGQDRRASHLSRFGGCPGTTNIERPAFDFHGKFGAGRRLQPREANLGKRHVKAPRVYVRYSSLLPGVPQARPGAGRPAAPEAGTSWEGFAIEEVIEGVRPGAAYFWATHTGAELDLLLTKEGRPALRREGQVPGRRACHPVDPNAWGRLQARAR